MAAALAEKDGISCEIVDLRTILPWDVDTVVNSVKKTNRLVVLDEDVPGGASAYILQKIMEEQGGYKYLDAAPTTIASKEHRPAYGSDGDYFSKPNPDDVFDIIYNLMHEAGPQRFPKIY